MYLCGGHLLEIGVVLRVVAQFVTGRQYPSGDVWWGGFGTIWRQRGRQADVFPQPRYLFSERPDWMCEIVPGDDRAL